MADLAAVLDRRMADALDLVRAGEKARMHAPDSGSSGFRISRLEFLYELAYLRMFVAWENYLEQTLYRYMCGCASPRFGQQTLTIGKYFGSLKDAETAVLAGRTYRLWHNPTEVGRIANIHVVTGRHAQIMTSAATPIQHMAALRHRIAHDQKDGALKCDTATMFFVGRRYPGARPGRFLRDWDTPTQRWLERLRTDLLNLSRQIA
jgi:hypothetical protein